MLEGARATFRRRESRRRTLILLLVATFLLDMLAMMGRHAVLFLYFRRQFSWTHVEYSRYLTAFGILGVVAQITLVPFLSGRLRWKDTRFG